MTKALLCTYELVSNVDTWHHRRDQVLCPYWPPYYNGVLMYNLSGIGMLNMYLPQLVLILKILTSEVTVLILVITTERSPTVSR